MQISDVEVLSINIESNIQALMDRHQEEVVSRSLELAAALKTSGNQAVVESIAGAIAPYAIAEGKPVSRAVSELLRGTTLESVFEDFAKKND